MADRSPRSTARNESSSTAIAAPPSTVFAILADPRQHQLIDGSGTLRGVVEGPERLELGARFGMRMKQGAPYTIKNRVVEFEPDRLIAWRHVGVHLWRYELEPTSDGGTRVTETWDLSHYPGFAAAGLHALFGKKTRAAITETLVRLKAAAEADAT
jgi:uncharacterized protein YndB with AHSA1/START domain